MMWGRITSCAAVCNRRRLLAAEGPGPEGTPTRPQIKNLPHRAPSVAVFAQLLHRQRGLQLQLSQQLLDVLGEDVALQVDTRAGPVTAQRGVAPSVRDEG